MMVKRLFVATAVAVVLMAAPAAAQQYPPAVNSFTVSDTTPTPGQTITAQGRTFAPGAGVTMTLSSVPVVIANGSADAAGVVTVDATIPADTPIGPHTITAAGEAPDGSPLSLTVSINVVPADGEGESAAGADSGSSLPRTGDDTSMPLARIGLLLAAIGGIITAVAAKRRKSAAAAA
jgi:LPXTG-motif cell wall-anchored protein